MNYEKCALLMLFDYFYYSIVVPVTFSFLRKNTFFFMTKKKEKHSIYIYSTKEI